MGQKRPNAWGLYDVHGNVWEWVQDCWVGNYDKAPRDGSAREKKDCARRVLRGGSWNTKPRHVRSAYRNWNPPATRHDYLGFRLAQDIEN